MSQKLGKKILSILLCTSMALGSFSLTSFADESDISVSEQDNVVAIENANVRLEYDLAKGSYDAIDKRHNTTVLEDAYSSYNGEQSLDNGYTFSYTTQQVSDTLGNGTMLMIKAEKADSFTQYLGFSLYEGRDSIIVSPGIENTTDEIIKLMEFRPIDRATAFPDAELKNLSMLDGNSGHWENVDSLGKSWNKQSTSVRHSGSVRCRNNILVTYGTEFDMRSLVIGGITYHEFEKYTQTGLKSDDNAGSSNLGFEKNHNVSMYAKDPYGKRVDPGTKYMPDDRFYIDFSIDSPFEILESYAFALKDAMEINISYYGYPTLCLWNIGHYGTGGSVNNATKGVGVMDQVVKSGFLKYTPVAVRLEPDTYSRIQSDGTFKSNEQGWWDDEHWLKYGHLTKEYPTMKAWGDAIAERGGIPHIYMQTNAMSEDIARLKPEWQLFNKNTFCYTEPEDYDGAKYDPQGGKLWDRLGGANGSKQGWDYTDPDFVKHMEGVYENLRVSGIKGIKFDYVDTAWNTDGFDDPYTTTAAAYRKVFEVAKKGLGEGSFIDERTLYNGMDLALGTVDSQRIQTDNGKINKEMISLGGLRWYKDRVVVNYDFDSKNLNAMTTRDSLRNLLTMCYATSGRIVLANVFDTLTEEQVFDVSRIFPMHDYEKSHRPVNAFVKSLPDIYAMEIEPGWQSLIFYNTNDSSAQKFSTKLSGDMAFGGLELDANKYYYIYDFWNDSYVGRFKGSDVFEDTVRAGEARVYAVHEDKGVPQLLSTNRHLLQGAIDTENIQWNASSDQLTGTLKVVKEDTYKAVFHIPTDKKIKDYSVDQGKAEISMVGSNLELTVNTEENADVNFTLTFEDKPYVAVENMTIDQHELTIKKTETAQLSAVFTPSDASVQDVEWTTSDDTVATVNSRGIVTGQKVGTAEITAASAEGGFTDTCLVTVEALPGPDFEFPHFEDFENFGELQMIDWYSMMGQWGTKQEGSNTVMASTAGSGNSALYYGSPDWEDYAFEADVRLDTTATAGLLIRAEKDSLRKAYITDFEKGQLRVFSRDKSSAKVTVPNQTWNVGDWHHMRIEVEGSKIRGYRDGILIGEITDSGLKKGMVGLFTYNGKASFDNIKIVPLDYVDEGELTDLQMGREDATLRTGETLQLNAVRTPADNKQDVFWSSGDESVATVDENGYVTAVKPGKTTIAVANGDESLRAISEVTVVDEAMTLFADDFESGSMKGWSVLEGEWAVKDEGGNKVMSVLSTNDGKRADIFAGNQNWKNYVFEADVRLDSGSTVGILARADQNELKKSYILDFENGKMRIFSRDNNKARVEVPGFTLDHGKWYHFRIEVEGDTIRGYRDGQFIAEIKDTGLPIGQIGLFCFNGTASYDNVNVFVPGIEGNVSGSGKLGVTDLLLIKSEILGRTAFTDTQRMLADVNQDGIINIFDLVAIKMKILRG
ncbi:Ig-like domain-containing protein [Candidatus Soleaferrea massiliensis]|uniref:Ig-like domain-containing protein n=1 Tax=Candidatus Soleaferrea massiliensis TaxID=1470354 RepID=UPI0006950C25|nr:Ig-like domain-containing protein [Candidatus Soleaferrea massiliensis]